MGCCPFTFLHDGTICLEVKNRSAVLFVLARHKTAVVVRRSCWDAAAPRDRQPACPLRIVAVGWQTPLAALVWIARPPVWEKSWRTRRPAPRMKLGAAAIQLWRGSTPLIYQGQKTQEIGLAYRLFFKYFFIFSKPLSLARSEKGVKLVAST